MNGPGAGAAAATVPPLAQATAVGWFGKIPAAGDFVTRRLPPTFVQVWDRWLQQGMAAARARLNDRWDDVYLTFPVWRFLCPPGSMGACGWAGVLMPSVDRVGRYFPLTLTASVNGLDFAQHSLPELEAQLLPLEQAGLSALDGEDIDLFDLRVRGLRPIGLAAGILPPLASLRDEATTGHWRLPTGGGDELVRAASADLLSFLGRRVIWWLPGNETGGGTIRLDRWPLSAEAFEELILHD